MSRATLVIGSAATSARHAAIAASDRFGVADVSAYQIRPSADGRDRVDPRDALPRGVGVDHVVHRLGPVHRHELGDQLVVVGVGVAERERLGVGPAEAREVDDRSVVAEPERALDRARRAVRCEHVDADAAARHRPLLVAVAVARRIARYEVECVGGEPPAGRHRGRPRHTVGESDVDRR